MNTNELTLDGYFGLELAARMSVAAVPCPHTSDRWNELEQHVWPKDHWVAARTASERTEQDVLWERKLWVTLTTGSLGAYVSPQHFRKGLAQDVAAALGRPVKIIVKFNLRPWECNPKKRVLTDEDSCERTAT
jgi:hypothetical protein